MSIVASASQSVPVPLVRLVFLKGTELEQTVIIHRFNSYRDMPSYGPAVGDAPSYGYAGPRPSMAYQALAFSNTLPGHIFNAFAARLSTRMDLESHEDEMSLTIGCNPSDRPYWINNRRAYREILRCVTIAMEHESFVRAELAPELDACFGAFMVPMVPSSS